MKPERIHRLAVLAEVADCGSISGAARRLGLVKSSISHHIAALEDEIGAKLLDRAGRGVRLTAVGEVLAAHGKTIIKEANQALQAAKVAEMPQGSLRISVPAGIADPFILPMLASFLRRYPGLSLEVVATDDMVDLAAERIDVAFRIGNIESGPFVARKLTEDRNIFVASAQYLARSHPISVPADLNRHEFIGLAAFGKRQFFQLEASDGSRTEIEMHCRVTTTHGFGILSWAQAGVGLARMPLGLVKPNLENGSLVRVLPDYTAGTFPLSAIYMPERFRPANARRLIDHAIAHFKGQALHADNPSSMPPSVSSRISKTAASQGGRS
jgi:molybdate transport repressor ModE-like protein